MITKNYIKMCEKAGKIQKEWIQSIGDLFIYKKDIEKAFNWPGCFYFMTEDRKYKNAIWLPTQGQLQEVIVPILERKFKDLWDMKRINIWVTQHFINFMHDIDYLDTLNEFWLAFVMKEKYNKIWSGKDWAKE